MSIFDKSIEDAGIFVPIKDRFFDALLFDRFSDAGVGGIMLNRRGILSTPGAKAKSRIGPHDIDVLSILIGSLLGNCHLERSGNGSRFCFQQEGSHEDYLKWFYDYLAIRGYATSNIPKIQTRMGEGGKIRKVLRFKTWTYSSFNWIHELFYIRTNYVGVKVVPDISILDMYIRPLALAVWIADDGGRVGSGLKLSTNSFKYEECMILVELLRIKYGLVVTIQSSGAPDQYVLFIHKQSIELLYKIVEPHLHPSMKYKFNIKPKIQ